MVDEDRVYITVKQICEVHCKGNRSLISHLEVIITHYVYFSFSCTQTESVLKVETLMFSDLAQFSHLLGGADAEISLQSIEAETVADVKIFRRSGVTFMVVARYYNPETGE